MRRCLLNKQTNLVNRQRRNEHLPAQVLLVDGHTPQFRLHLFSQYDPNVFLGIQERIVILWKINNNFKSFLRYECRQNLFQIFFCAKSKHGRTPVKLRSQNIVADDYKYTHIRKYTNPNISRYPQMFGVVTHKSFCK